MVIEDVPGKMADPIAAALQYQQRDHMERGVEYARKVSAGSIVRGLRATSDFENEFQMALFNRRLAPEITTVFLMTSFANVFLSSSLIKEVARHGGAVDFAVPPSVARRLAQLTENRGQ